MLSKTHSNSNSHPMPDNSNFTNNGHEASEKESQKEVKRKRKTVVIVADYERKTSEPAQMILSSKTKSYLSVFGTSLIYFAMGLYFAAGNTGVYLTSYLVYKSNNSVKLDDAIWFLSTAGFSALFLPAGGLIEQRLGIKFVCFLGGLLQSLGIFGTYFALDSTFLHVVVVYGGSFLVSLAICYTPPLVNVCRWHPSHKGLVSGIGAASMAVAPTLFTPLITWIVNPHNLPPNSEGLFDSDAILARVKYSILVQGSITLTLFLVGTLLTFQAPDNSQEQDKDLEAGAGAGSKPNAERYTAAAKTGSVPTRLSIEPSFAFRTSEFWLLSFKVLISELIFIYLLFIYKPYGQTFIQDDYFLSTVGAACAISNTIGRLSMGHLKDKFGYKAVSIPLSALSCLFVALLPLTKHLDSKLAYGSSIVLAVGAVGSQYALIPSAAQDSFGQKYASVNIGFVYMSTVIATVSSALLSQHLTSVVGWQGMICLIAVFAFCDFVATFLMPANPHKRLECRHRQFYSPDKTSRHPSAATGALVFTCPSCNCAFSIQALKCAGQAQTGAGKGLAIDQEAA